MKNMNRLELNWVGKGEPIKLEPRILIEDIERSFNSENTENMLIHGDNLLALKALESEFYNKIQCIYIDPPFNTGNAFEHYDDSIEHSIWLSLMKERLLLLKNLLNESGVIVVHLDDKEMAYCKVLMDEIFGRYNYLNTITMTTNEPSGFKATSSKIFSTANFLLIYAKDRTKVNIKKVFKEKGYDTAYSKIFTNMEGDYKSWEWMSFSEFLALKNGYKNAKEARKELGKENFEQLLRDNSIKYSRNLFRTASIGGGAKIKRYETIQKSKSIKGEIFVHPNEDVEEFYILNGEQILFYKKRLEEIDGKLVPAEVITDVWTDISWTGIANEGGVQFKNGKKPELLIKRILEIFTEENDYVLDSFAGSGTTAAVAHKMKRKWITIEMGEQCYTHCYKRLKNIVLGNDTTGISKIFNWNGGGGFKFYELAPSLLNRDVFGNWVINKEYDAEMLSNALCKIQGFKYNPNQDIYWKQGLSNEHDFIYVTTNFMTVEHIDKIYSEMKESESLLICCKSYQKECEDRYEQIDIRKIPQAILDKCEFGNENYDLNIRIDDL